MTMVADRPIYTFLNTLTFLNLKPILFRVRRAGRGRSHTGVCRWDRPIDRCLSPTVWREATDRCLGGRVQKMASHFVLSRVGVDRTSKRWVAITIRAKREVVIVLVFLSQDTKERRYVTYSMHDHLPFEVLNHLQVIHRQPNVNLVKV